MTMTRCYADDGRDDLMKRMIGVWEIRDGVNMGRELTAQELDGVTVVIDRDTIITYDKDQKEIYRAVFELNLLEKPVEIDMTTATKGMPATESLGILKFTGENKWRLAYAMPKTERPEKFESPKGSKIMLFDLARKK
jgi:uncharacterized protein (TIGR03067 family)